MPNINYTMLHLLREHVIQENIHQKLKSSHPDLIQNSALCLYPKILKKSSW